MIVLYVFQVNMCLLSKEILHGFGGNINLGIEMDDLYAQYLLCLTVLIVSIEHQAYVYFMEC